MTYGFFDDYSEGCHPEILAAFGRTNDTQEVAYGNDRYSVEARRRIAELCGQPDMPVQFVSGGTLANLIVSAAVLRPHEAIISASSGHIAMRETGAIEATGHKIITMPSVNGKLTPADVAQAVAGNAQVPHMAKPKMVYISNATEFGTVYSLAELTALRSACDAHNLLLMIDGARIGVAIEASDVTLTDIAAIADVFWIGGTKAGALFGEAIVFPNRELASDFEFHLKQRGALLAKGRALGVQFLTLFADDLFGRLCRSSNEAAQKLSAGVVAAGFELAATTESNQVFAILPNATIAALQESFGFYVWEPLDHERSVIRLVTSWATDPDQVDRFISTAARLA